MATGKRDGFFRSGVKACGMAMAARFRSSRGVWGVFKTSSVPGHCFVALL